MPTLMPAERIGTTIAGKFRVEALLGEGGMGLVYRATDIRLHRPVALKLLKPELLEKQPELGARFETEARAAARLDHPNVVVIHELGSDDGLPYIAQELLRGASLDRLLEEEGGVLSVARAAELLLPAMEGVAYAHRHGIVHRDLKPENIFVHVDARGREVPKVLDFGIARMDDAKGPTRTGQTVGTLFYMSPEQLRAKDVGAWCDVWSMAVVWFQCLTGTFPFEFEPDESAFAAMAKILSDTPMSVGLLAPDVPARLAAAIDRGLEKRHAERAQDMDAFIEAIEAGLAAPTHPPRLPATMRMEAAAMPHADPAMDVGATIISPPPDLEDVPAPASRPAGSSPLARTAPMASPEAQKAGASAVASASAPAVPVGGERILGAMAIATIFALVVALWASQRAPAPPVAAASQAPPPSLAVSAVREAAIPVDAQSVDAGGTDEQPTVLPEGVDPPAHETRLPPVARTTHTPAARPTELTPDQITEVRTAGQRGLTQCWETALRAAGGVDGDVRYDVDLTIGSSGRVTAVSARGPTVAGLGSCIERSVRRWSFPASSGETETTFPIVFSARDDDTPAPSGAADPWTGTYAGSYTVVTRDCSGGPASRESGVPTRFAIVRESSGLLVIQRDCPTYLRAVSAGVATVDTSRPCRLPATATDPAMRIEWSGGQATLYGDELHLRTSARLTYEEVGSVCVDAVYTTIATRQATR